MKKNHANIRGAIFDVDGTLLDTMKIWKDVGARYLKKIGVTPEENLGHILYSMSIEEGTGYVKKRYNLPYTTDEIREGTLQVMADFYKNDAEMKNGMKSIIENYNAQNIKMIIATTSNKPLVKSALERLGILQYFCDILTATELNTNKREPLMYRKAAEILGSKPEEIAVYEDMFEAIKTTKNAGFYVIGIYDDTNKEYWEEIKKIADETIGGD